jgi:polyhydroxybutyrate depolymerase
MLQAVLLLAIVAAEPSTPLDPVRKIEVDGRTRSYSFHVPPQYDPEKPTPVVLVFHGAATNCHFITHFSGVNKKADAAGFIAVYPNGTGLVNTLLTWNSGGLTHREADERPDDVKFVKRLLDDLAQVANIDPKRVYATGHSNGAMMCYRLAVELSDRIAAIAPVGGTMGVDVGESQRPVSVIHFHGTLDKLVPWNGPNGGTREFLTFKSVTDTVRTWASVNGCSEEPVIDSMPDKADDGTTVVRKNYGQGKDNAEVVLYVIEGGGHTWPGEKSPVAFLGKSTFDISANDLIWEFFQKHPMK